ncbi:VWA domain-containing protein [Microvenator marinus]|uniref:VWA domain-containing protein n=2 Tax=Microvenator marinus TaxID=2600177 RepID=A0A5B8XS41_9DELT|nr:VWA domain-containing protein [Microvenator marinus]
MMTRRLALLCALSLAVACQTENQPKTSEHADVEPVTQETSEASVEPKPVEPGEATDPMEALKLVVDTPEPKPIAQTEDTKEEKDIPKLKAQASQVGGLGLIGSGRGGGGVGYGHGVGSLGSRGTGARIGGRSLGDRISRSNNPDFVDYGTNPVVRAEVDRFATFAADVDNASYTMARRALNEGRMPHPSLVRVEEFVNAFPYNYGVAKDGPFAVHTEAAPSPFSTDPNTRILRVGVQARELEKKERGPVHLTFLVDVSGSMSRPDKLPLAQRALNHLLDNMRPEDSVAVVTYASSTKVVLPKTSLAQKERIKDAVDSLSAGGSTAMGEGLELAYREAAKNLQPGHVSRIIVLSDGDANVGSSSHDEILKRIRGYVQEGVTLSTVGFGMRSFKDPMMEQLANKGDGNYAYIDSFEEAKRFFGSELDGTLHVIAKDVKFQVEFHPEHVETYRIIGYENREVADKDFRNDAVDAGEVGPGHRVTALFEVKLKHREPAQFATVRIRHIEPGQTSAIESRYPLHLHRVRTTLGHASHELQFAVAVAGFAEILRKSPYAKDLSYDLVLEVAESSAGSSAKRRELVDLIKAAKRLDSQG